MPDTEITTESAQLEDYRKSGYDRGHMAPAADMGFSEKTMKESFYLSNMCPQLNSFNGDIWSDLEQKMRYWATIEGELYIVTGPILSKRKRNTIGPNKVAAPSAFYKTILAPSPTPKAICFLLPHKGPHKPLQAHTLTVDELEEKTGLDFFSALPDDIENTVEASFTLDAWKWDEKDIVKKRPPKKMPSK